MAGRGKPRTRDSATGRHDYTFEQSLSFWQKKWKAQIDSQPPKVRQETIERMRRLLAETRYRSALHDLAVCYGPMRDGDGDESTEESPT